MTRMYHQRLCSLLQTATILLFIAIITGRAEAAPEAPEQVVERLQQRYQEITGLSFTFSQKTSGQLAGRPRTGSGKGFLLNDEERTLMRWDYHHPEQQVVISDGVSVSMYFEKLNQMIIAPADTTQTDVLISFFTGDQVLGETFLIQPAETDRDIIATNQSGELTGVQLIPRRPHAQLRTVHLYVDTDSLIRRIDMLDHFDTRTTIDLADIEIDPFDDRNGAVVDEVFSFTPPPGTEIIRQ